MLHKNAPLADRHPIHNWEYASMAARLSILNTYSAEDIGKLAYQTDIATFYLLSSLTPITWLPITIKNAADIAITPKNGITALTVQEAIYALDARVTALALLA